MAPKDRPPHVETIIQHLAEEERLLGAVVPPIFQNSLFVYDDWDKFKGAFEPGSNEFLYSRISNPTLDVLERKIAALEHTDRAKVFSSGMGAISAAIMSCVHAGAHVVCVDTCYGPTRIFLKDYLTKFGVETTFVVGDDPQEVFDAVRENTSLIYLESPSSVVFRMQDLRAISDFAKARGISTAIDNSYASPIFQQPADFGIDLVAHTASKYLGGHSDLVAGVLCTSDERMTKITGEELALFGGILAPITSWLMLRSMRTLSIRMRAVQESGLRMAEWLMGRKEVQRVLHPAMAEGRQGELFRAQMSGTGGLLSFIPRKQDEQALRSFVKALTLFSMGVSWGGHESLVVPIQAQPMDWPGQTWVVRLYCGLENIDDLIGDVEQAFEASGL